MVSSSNYQRRLAEATVADSDFDPYHKWLGIPPEEQPPNYYRLLGLRLFENDPETIDFAAEQRMFMLRNVQGGPRGQLCQKMLNEVAAARHCLLDSCQRDLYNASLRDSTEKALPRPAEPPRSSNLPPPLPIPPIHTADTRPTKTCPYCAETILAAAIKCRYCGEFLEDNDGRIDHLRITETKPEPKPFPQDANHLTPVLIFVGTCVLIILIIFTLANLPP